MTTIAGTIARGLPKPVAEALRPYWHRAQMYASYFCRGGRLRYDRTALCLVASKPMPGGGRGKRMEIAARSGREFRRFATYGESQDKVYDWLCDIPSDGVLWDIGSSNGLEGFLANRLTGCRVVFIEPFTPSIESILKTRYVAEQRAGTTLPVDVVHAACADQPGFGRLLTHTKPVAGETCNSIGGSLDEYCAGGRGDMRDVSSQWIKFVTLDELLDRGIEPPTHLKMDVDGLEMRVLAGAERVLDRTYLVSAAIEVNDDNVEPVEAFMTHRGFTCTGRFVHHEAPGRYTADHFYGR